VTGERWCADLGERSFFVNPTSIHEGRADLVGPVAHQIRNVLRLRPGDEVELLDGSGLVLVARLSKVSKEGVVAEIVESRWSDSEPEVELVLYQALLKGQKMELVLQKGTEIGVSRFVPVLSDRCISRPDARDMARRLERWGSVVREAAEQSGRAVLPVVAGLVRLEDGCREAASRGPLLMAWEGEHQLGVRGALTVVASYLLLGPFHGRFGSAYSQIELWRGPRTPLKDYLVIHGVFLFILAFYLIALAFRPGVRNGLARTVRFFGRHWKRRWRAWAARSSR